MSMNFFINLIMYQKSTLEIAEYKHYRGDIF